MSNVGEEIVGCYLQEILGCSFVQYNLHHPDVQGEIDVIGLDIENRRLYVCEVVTHLITGILYTKNSIPDNVKRLLTKFENDIQYAREHFDDFEHVFMLWSPIVKPAGQAAKHNQMKDVQKVARLLKSRFEVDLHLVINERYLSCLKEIRAFARKETKALVSPVLRLMQIEEKLEKHVQVLERRRASSNK